MEAAGKYSDRVKLVLAVLAFPPSHLLRTAGNHLNSISKNIHMAWYSKSLLMKNVDLCIRGCAM